MALFVPAGTRTSGLTCNKCAYRLPEIPTDDVPSGCLDVMGVRHGARTMCRAPVEPGTIPDLVHGMKAAVEHSPLRPSPVHRKRPYYRHRLLARLIS